MSVFKKLLVSAFLLGAFAAAQNPVVSEQSKSCKTLKPECQVKFLVRFDGNPELDGLGLSFALTGTAKKDQSGMSGGFSINEVRKVSDGVFEVTGKIPNGIASGTYQLTQVTASHKMALRAYHPQTDFPPVTTEVLDDIEYDFPAIKTVTEESPRP